MAEYERKQTVELQEKELARLLDWIGKADSKAQIVIGANIAMIGALMALTPDDAKKDGWALFWVAFACAFPTLSLYQCFAAAMPHILPPNAPWIERLMFWKRDIKPSLIFFGGITAHCKTLESYASKVENRSEGEYLDDLNNQCFANAQIAAAKFRRLARAWYALFLGLFPWIGVILWLYRAFENKG